MPGLKITLLQQPLIWMDGPANLRHFDRQLETVAGRDVIVLPEMFTSGFAMEAANKSLPQEEVVSWMTSDSDVWIKRSNRKQPGVRGNKREETLSGKA